ncbi:hypothetical protein LCGC14_3075600 [marine sediment metagenome]|uniref:Peptidase S74 domain-containing protein n=1 Tax=marine sediment metagenome TaxID=412755 RepID=A0A0F8YMC0_9ZZZZ
MFGLDFIRKLKPCKWRYKPPLDDGVEHFGFIAQDVDEIAPKEKYAFVVGGQDNDLHGMHLGEFIGPLTKAIQELDAKVTELENELKNRGGDGLESGRVENDQVSDNDSLGFGHDMAAYLGNLRGA